MKSRNAGIWIDHKQAILVSMQGVGVPLVERISSYVESHGHPSGGWKAGGSTSVAQSISDEHRADRRRARQFHNFYRMIIREVGKADEVFVFGPGEAKSELVKEIESIKGPHVKVAAVETADKLTENEIVAKVRTFFGSAESARA